jgi:hypothetical protein
VALGSRSSRRKRTDPVEETVDSNATDFPSTAVTNTEQESNEVTETDTSNTEQQFSWDAAPAEEPAATPETVTDEAATDAAPAKEKPKGPSAEEKLAAEQAKARELIHNAYPENAIVRFEKTDWRGQYGLVKGIVDKRNVPYVQVVLTHYLNREERPDTKKSVVDVRPTSIEVVQEVPAPDPKPEPKVETKADETAGAE